MILEGIVTTLNEDGSVNVSPMGPEVDRPLTRFVLKPFQTSRTYQNLKRTGGAVFHVVDDVELLARCAVGEPDPMPELLPRTDLPAPVLAEACRWYALEVALLDDASERTRIECRLTQQGTLRDLGASLVTPNLGQPDFVESLPGQDQPAPALHIIGPL